MENVVQVVNIEKLVEYRSLDNTKCYLLEKESGEYFVIYGTKYCVTVYGSFLHNAISAYINKDRKWSTTESYITSNRDNDNTSKDWIILDENAKKQEISVVGLYIDGEKSEIE